MLQLLPLLLLQSLQCKRSRLGLGLGLLLALRPEPIRSAPAVLQGQGIVTRAGWVRCKALHPSPRLSAPTRRRSLVWLGSCTGGEPARERERERGRGQLLGRWCTCLK